MRRWVRATVRYLRCGYCRAPIAVGDPMQLIELVQVVQPKRRCAKCAEGKVPADLPALDTSTRKSYARQKTVSHSGAPALPLDGKAAAAGSD